VNQALFNIDDEEIVTFALTHSVTLSPINSANDSPTHSVAGSPTHSVEVSSNHSTSESLSDNDIDTGNESDTMAGQLIPDAYHGLTSENPEEFMMDVEHWFAYRKLVDAEKLGAFPLLLKSSAKYWFSGLTDAQKASFDAVKAAFNTRFTGNTATAFKDMSDVIGATQRPDESVELFINRVQQLSRKANASEDQLKFSIINGLKPHIRQVVLTQQPDSIDDIRRVAIIAETAVPPPTDTSTLQLLQRLEQKFDGLHTRSVPQASARNDRSFNSKGQFNTSGRSFNRGQFNERRQNFARRTPNSTYPPRMQTYNRSSNVTTSHLENQSTAPQTTSGEFLNTCTRCNRYHDYNQCAARGKTCNYCQLKNHYSICCRSRIAAAGQGQNC
jgi:hypothetical protein